MWNNETKVNWSEIAKRYNILNKSGKLANNGGQIAKEYLQNTESEGFMYTYFGKQDKRQVIRRKRKCIEATEIGVPCDVSAKKVKQKLEDEIQSGKVSIGHLINPKTYVKYVVKNGVISTTEFIVEGHKHKMYEIREKLFKKQQIYMRLNTDDYFKNITLEELTKRLNQLNELEDNMDEKEMSAKLMQLERSRNIQMWHDASTIANHSHMLFSINILYDTAVFYTEKEFYDKYGKEADIQSIVETPELYIIGRCRSTDEQLGYIDTREECLNELTVAICADSINIKDTMRLFHGDGPAVQFESGHQKGGHYFCPNCEVCLYQTDDISYSYQLKVNSLKYKQQMVISGKYGRKHSVEGKIKPFQKLTAIELKEELSSRQISTSMKKTTKKDLEPMLKKELKGCTRVPVMLKNDPIYGMENLNLLHYETALVEPMHDIGGHIVNIFEELPHHLTITDQKIFNEALHTSYKLKETQRNVDRRKSLLMITAAIYGKINNKVLRLLKTLVEIQRIIYLQECGRTSQEILRLHNSCFQHFVLLKEVIGFDLKKLTRRKLYGKYMHNLLVHSPIQLRIINGQSINCEGEERFFNTIKQITATTSSYRPGHIIGNCIIRHQIESRCKESYQCTETSASVNKEIRNLNKVIEDYQYDTLVSYDYIKNNATDWQSHLERISDFLVLGEGIWWKKSGFGVECFDKTNLINYPIKPKVHHFRSHNIQQTQELLHNNWNVVLENKVVIPTHEIYTENSNRTAVVKEITNFLEPYLSHPKNTSSQHSNNSIK